jgi:Flp pilus assembly protein TadD
MRLFARRRRVPSPAQIRRAARLFERGRQDEALEILKRLQGDYPEDVPLALAFGGAYHKAGRHSLAVEQFRRVTELEPTNAKAWLNMAAAHNALGHVDRAEAALSRLAEISPDYPDLHYNTAILRLKRRQPLQAMAELELELAVSPGHLLASRMLEQLRRQLIS